jgi:hypothetical protein
MGTIQFIPDASHPGHDIGLYDHEGWVEYRLSRPLVLPPLFPDGQPSVYEGWTTLWTKGVDELRCEVRAGCDCGWRGPSFPWPGRDLLEGDPTQGAEATEEQRDALMLAWDRHVRVDVIQDLAWSACLRCDELFAVAALGRPAEFCSDACRQADYRARH